MERFCVNDSKSRSNGLKFFGHLGLLDAAVPWVATWLLCNDVRDDSVKVLLEWKAASGCWIGQFPAVHVHSKHEGISKHLLLVKRRTKKTFLNTQSNSPNKWLCFFAHVSPLQLGGCTEVLPSCGERKHCKGSLLDWTNCRVAANVPLKMSYEQP